MRLGRKTLTVLFGALLLTFAVSPLMAMPVNGLDTARLSPLWAMPFLGILLSIALLPLATPQFWHRHFGKISVFWALAFFIPCAFVFTLPVAFTVTWHTLLADFIPFTVILIALYTVAGGIYVQGNLHGTAMLNTIFLGAGSLLASVIGTTGASMALIRPLLRANDARKYNTHVAVFFIFLVSNIGGALTPLGDPPLFLGYLKGVPFFWPTQHLFLPMLLCLTLVLAAFFILDRWLFAHETSAKKDETPDMQGLELHGLINIPLMALVIAAVLFSSLIDLGETHLMGAALKWSNALRDTVLLATAGLSLWLTPPLARRGNDFNWEPVREVTLLFFAIFLTAIPVLAMLHQGRAGAFGALIDLVFDKGGMPDNVFFFWLTGLLSAFLDNAPTYLVFFQLAGGDTPTLTGPLAQTLTAISCGAVFMGAMSYIGNAPNFMVRAIAQNQGVKMPGFFGYMAWSCAFLLPVFALVTFIFFI